MAYVAGGLTVIIVAQLWVLWRVWRTTRAIQDVTDHLQQVDLRLEQVDGHLKRVDRALQLLTETAESGFDSFAGVLKRAFGPGARPLPAPSGDAAAKASSVGPSARLVGQIDPVAPQPTPVAPPALKRAQGLPTTVGPYGYMNLRPRPAVGREA